MAITKGPRRRPDQQRIHDLVIAALASEYTKRGYVVHTNPNQQKNWAISGHYPDVVVLAMAGARARLIVEVETSDSVRGSEAASQWVQYDQRYGAWLLAVPKHVRATAKKLIEEHELEHVRLVTWSFDFTGLPR